MNYFTSKVRYEKTLENGLQKKVTEAYLVDAVSWTDAEVRTIEEVTPFVSGEMEIVDISKAGLSEIFFFEDGDRYFKAKVLFITLDEKSGTEKKTATSMLVQACDIDQAHEVLKKGMEGTMADWECASMTETKIMDVFTIDSDKVNKVTLNQ